MLLSKWHTITTATQKRQAIKEAWPLLLQTYKSVGGASKFTGKNIIVTTGAWGVFKQSSVIVAGILYKDVNATTILYAFHNNTTVGKNILKHKLKKDVYANNKWAEVTGHVSLILKLMGAKCIPYEQVKQLLSCEIEDDGDEFHYLREVSGGLLQRVVVMGEMA